MSRTVITTVSKMITTPQAPPITKTEGLASCGKPNFGVSSTLTVPTVVCDTGRAAMNKTVLKYDILIFGHMNKK